MRSRIRATRSSTGSPVDGRRCAIASSAAVDSSIVASEATNRAAAIIGAPEARDTSSVMTLPRSAARLYPASSRRAAHQLRWRTGGAASVQTPDGAPLLSWGHLGREDPGPPDRPAHGCPADDRGPGLVDRIGSLGRELRGDDPLVQLAVGGQRL